MDKEFLSQEEVDALLKGVNGESDDDLQEDQGEDLAQVVVDFIRRNP